MSIETVNLRPSDVLPANTLLRLTFSSHWYDLAGQFSGAARTLYQSLFSLAGVLPTTTLSVINDSKNAVIDARLNVRTNGSTLINALDNAGQRFAFISRAEVLTGSARTQSSSDSGTGDRDSETLAAETRNGGNGIGNPLAPFGGLISAIKWGGVGIAVLAGLYFLSPYLARKK